MTQYQFYGVCDSDQLNYGKSPNYDRNSIRMAVIRKMPFISSFYYLDFFEQHWKAQTDRYKVQTSTWDRWMYFACHSLDMFKGLYFFILLSIGTVVMAMTGIMWIQNVPVSVKMAGLSSVTLLSAYWKCRSEFKIRRHFSLRKPTWWENSTSNCSYPQLKEEIFTCPKCCRAS